MLLNGAWTALLTPTVHKQFICYEEIFVFNDDRVFSYILISISDLLHNFGMVWRRWSLYIVLPLILIVGGVRAMDHDALSDGFWYIVYLANIIHTVRWHYDLILVKGYNNERSYLYSVVCRFCRIDMDRIISFVCHFNW